ncbi:MAG: Rpn family recombination-promoting nuclease/putative transposase [Planctomycetes bacterium]|nr:Rpn family recombination-promoting nuclease/putative transposase [Planctomycetota bacterium]
MGIEAPHDTFFRAIFQRAAPAASWLGTLLPAAVLGALDATTLSPAAGTALGVRLLRHHADLVFTAALRHNRAPVLLLLEHKAQPDADLPSQLLRYAVHLRRAARRRQRGPEPLVLAAVLHHGATPLPGPASHPHLAELPPAQAAAFAALQPQLAFVADDLAAQDEAALHRPGLVPTAELALLCLRSLRGFAPDEVLAAFDRWADLLRAVDADAEGGPDVVDAVGWYALAVTEVPAADLSEAFARILRRPEDTIMSTLERTYLKGLADGKAEGLAKGKTEGIARGKAEGKAEGRIETILRLLGRRFGPLPPAVAARVRQGSPAELDRWTDRVLEAATLDGVFAD